MALLGVYFFSNCMFVLYNRIMYGPGVNNESASACLAKSLHCWVIQPTFEHPAKPMLTSTERLAEPAVAIWMRMLLLLGAGLVRSNYATCGCSGPLPRQKSRCQPPTHSTRPVDIALCESQYASVRLPRLIVHMEN